MGGEEEDDLLPLALVGETLLQRLPDVVREGPDESGVRSPAVDEAPFHRRRVAADRRKINGMALFLTLCRVQTSPSEDDASKKAPFVENQPLTFGASTVHELT